MRIAAWVRRDTGGFGKNGGGGGGKGRRLRSLWRRGGEVSLLAMGRCRAYEARGTGPAHCRNGLSTIKKKAWSGFTVRGQESPDGKKEIQTGQAKKVLPGEWQVSSPTTVVSRRGADTPSIREGEARAKQACEMNLATEEQPDS